MISPDVGTADLIDLRQTPAVLDALYRYADPDSYCALRVFRHERGQPPPWAADVKAGDLSALIEAIARGARYSATSTTPTVFCPATGCTFRHPGTAKTRDIAEGLALAVELDDGDTAAVLERLETRIGPPTLVVLSGSFWADPETGELHPKRHAYWRLSEAAKDEADLTLLYAARRNAALLTGADPTGAALAHCYRWPGSLNRKRPHHPVLCTVDRINPDAEIHLIDAAELLADAVEGAGLNGTGHKSNSAYQGRRELQADPALVAAAMATIPNPDAHYNEWVRMAYAVAGATGGTGYDILLNWSAKSSKHHAGETEALWSRVLAAGATHIGAGSIFHEAKQHGWTDPRRKKTEAPEDGSPDAGPDSDEQPEPASEPKADPLKVAIDRLAALPEFEFDRIKKAEAENLGLDDTGILSRAVARARRAARAKAEAGVKAAKAAAKEREAKAKADEKARKTTEARARLDAQKKHKLTDDDDDPLRDWTPPSPDKLPEIIIAPGERPAIADAALAAMAAARVPFYQRGKDVVRVCLIKLKLSNGKKVRVPAVSIVTRAMLMRALGLCATWHAYNKELDLVRIDPPGDLGDHILGMIGEWPFPPLRGVIATQTMRYDGSLLTEPGYDPATGLVLFNPPPIPAIPDQPTQNDALEALALLNDLLAEVKFAEDDNISLSGAISMMMTPVLRGMMAVAPMHVVTKPVAGTGGSYMQDITTAIALGERCPVLSLTLNNDEENEKRLSSAALAGQSIIAIDNFTGTLMGDFLCQLIERQTPQIRLLGKSELATITNNHCVLANGNNVTIGADTVRRTVQISLDANEENPETRIFTRNPVAEVLADRGRYIAAILTIARAYRVAGSPRKLPPRLSFEYWSDNVRSALVWLDLPDPDESIKAVRAADPISAKLHAVVAAWAAELTVNVGYYTGELVKLAEEYPGDGSSNRRRPALWDALVAVAGNKTGQVDATRLGQWLQNHLNRISAGHKLLVDRTNKARPRWRLEPR
jgi:putative DNA primase/helicase